MSCDNLILTLLTWTIWRAPTNASKWWMGFKSAFKGLIDITTVSPTIYNLGTEISNFLTNVKSVRFIFFAQYKTNGVSS